MEGKTLKLSLSFQQKVCRSEESGRIQNVKWKNLEPRLSFRIEGDMKNFPDKHKLKSY